MTEAARPRAVIAAGGTGGHFYPGLVLSRTLAERGWETLFLTRRADPGIATLEASGIPYAELDLAGLARSPSLGWVTFPFQTARAVGMACRILEAFKPRVVVGTGGYLTFPAIAAAARLGVPSAVHDSNSVLGLANRAAVFLGAKLFWGLPPAGGEAGTVTGTPIRPVLWRAGEPGTGRGKLGLDPGTATLLVFGGSQGAGGLNSCVPEAVRAAREGASISLQVVHLAGRRDAARVRAAYAAAKVPAAVLEYVEDMETAYAAADLVVSRSGAGTLAELAALRKPAVLVPYPHASGDHQTHNAAMFSKAGAAMLVPESALSARLPGILRDLLLSAGSAESRSRMAAAYAKLGLPRPEETARKLADAVEGLARR